MAATTQDLQRLLEDAWDNAPDTANTLREELRKNEKLVGRLVSQGSLASASQNSASQSYAFGGGQLTTAEVARAWRNLINLFDHCEGIVSVVSDETIYAEMRARMKAVYSTRLDMRRLHEVAL